MRRGCPNDVQRDQHRRPSARRIERRVLLDRRCSAGQGMGDDRPGRLEPLDGRAGILDQQLLLVQVVGQGDHRECDREEARERDQAADKAPSALAGGRAAPAIPDTEARSSNEGQDRVEQEFHTGTVATSSRMPVAGDVPLTLMPQFAAGKAHGQSLWIQQQLWLDL